MFIERKAKYSCSIVMVTLCFGFSQLSSAQDSKPNLSLGLGLQYDDNVYRQEQDRESDIRVNLSGVAGYRKIDNWYQLSLNYSANQNEYVDDSYQSNRLINGQSRLVIGKPSHWLSWFFSDTEQTTVIDVLSPDTPDNRSQRSIYSTGPQLNFQLTQVDRLQAGYSLTQVNVADSLADSMSAATSVNYLRQLSKTASAALSLSRTEVEPEVDNLAFLDGDNQYQQDRSSISFNKKIKNGNLSLTYGTSKVNGVKNISTGSSEEYSISVSRSFGFGAFDLSYSKSVSDSGVGSIEGVLNNPLGQQVFDIQENKLWQFIYTAPELPGRINLSFTSSQSEVNLLTRDATEQRQYNLVQANHQLSEDMKISVSAIHHLNKFNENEESKTLNFSIGVNYQINKKLNMGCSVNDERGTGDRAYDVTLLNCSANWRIY